MWLSLLLSLGAESASGSVRKAGVRELQQRLGLAPPKVSPGLYGRVQAWLASHPEAPDEARMVLRTPRVGILLEGLLKHLGATSNGYIVFPGGSSTDGLPYFCTGAGADYVRQPATIPTPLDASVGWWLEQVFQMVRRTENIAFWSVMDRAGLLREGAAERVQDWIEMTHPDLGRYTWATAKDASDAWHRQLAGSAGYGQPITGGDTRLLATWPDGAKLVQLMSKQDFAAEGTSMGHCVGGPHEVDEPAPGNGHYWQGHRDGRYAIVSYRNPEGRPLLTVNLQRDKEGRIEVEQAQGPMDELGPIVAVGRVLGWLVPFLRGAGAPEATVEMAIGTLFQTPPDTLFVSDAERAELLAAEDPFDLRSSLDTFPMSPSGDRMERFSAWLRGEHAALTDAQALTARVLPQCIDLLPVRQTVALLERAVESEGETSLVPLFSFGPHLEMAFGIGDRDIVVPWMLLAELAFSEDREDRFVWVEWQAYERDETFNDAEEIELPSSTDLNPFPALDKAGLLFNVDRLLAWLRPRLENHDAEAFDLTVVAPPLLGKTPL